MTDQLVKSQISIKPINGYEKKLQERLEWSRLTTFTPNKKLPIHRWFPYLQGFSSQLVENLLPIVNKQNGKVLDPFCGVGTTLLTCKNLGIESVGYDISPMAVFISNAKVRSDYDTIKILHYLEKLKNIPIQSQNIPDNEIFNKVFKKETLDEIITLRNNINVIDDDASKTFLLFALMASIEENSCFKKDGAHYRITQKPKSSSVYKSFIYNINMMINDIKQNQLIRNMTRSNALLGDARTIHLTPDTFSGIITSPPYLNRDSYIAQYKLELFLMEFIRNHKEYRDLTKATIRSHVEAEYVSINPMVSDEISYLVEEIEKRGVNNPKIPGMIVGYFDDMNIVLSNLSKCLAVGGKIALVVGNSAWSGVLIEADKLLSTIAASHGLTIENIYVTRYKLNSAQQIKKYGKIPIRESVIIASKET